MHLTTASCVLLVWIAVSESQFIYPDAESINDFHDKDTIVVSYMNPFSSARLLLYCNYIESRKYHPTKSSDLLTLLECSIIKYVRAEQ